MGSCMFLSVSRLKLKSRILYPDGAGLRRSNESYYMVGISCIMLSESPSEGHTVSQAAEARTRILVMCCCRPTQFQPTSPAAHRPKSCSRQTGDSHQNYDLSWLLAASRQGAACGEA